jgi:hypothetical protein
MISHRLIGGQVARVMYVRLSSAPTEGRLQLTSARESEGTGSGAGGGFYLLVYVCFH